MIPEWMDLTVNKYLSREKKTPEELLRSFLKSKDKRNDILRGGLYDKIYKEQLDKIAGIKSDSDSLSFRLNGYGYSSNYITFNISSSINISQNINITMRDNNQTTFRSSFDSFGFYEEFHDNDVDQTGTYYLTTKSKSDKIKYYTVSYPSEKNIRDASIADKEIPRVKFGERYVHDKKLGLKSVGVGLYCSKHPSEKLRYPWSKCPACAYEYREPEPLTLSEISDRNKRTICNKIKIPVHELGGIFNCHIDSEIPWITEKHKQQTEEPIEINFLIDDEIVTKKIRPNLIPKKSRLYKKITMIGHRRKMFYDFKTGALSKAEMFPWAVDEDATSNSNSIHIDESDDLLYTISSAV